MSLELTSNDLQNNFKMRELSGSKVYEFEDFRLDAEHLLLFRGGEQVEMTPKVVETLKALIERHGEVIGKDELMEIVWPDSIVEESNLSQNLYILRKALGTSAAGMPFIETLRRRGYRFSADVRAITEHSKQSEPARAMRVERSENIYSVVDWKQSDPKPEAAVEPVAKVSPEPAVPQRKALPTFAIGLVAMAVIVVIGVVAATRFWPSSGGASALNAPFGSATNELTFTHLTNGTDVNDATISPDGTYFVYHEIDGETQRLWLQQTGQSNRVELIPGSKWSYGSKTFSPDGRTIYFVAIEKGSDVAAIYRVPLLGGAPTKIANDASVTIAVSPDGKQIAFSRTKKDNSSSSIVVARSDGSDEHVIATSADGNVFWGGLAWSPDGRTIAYGAVETERPAVEGACNLLGIDPMSGVTRKLAPDGWDGCGRMEWTPDGKGLLFVGTRRGEIFSAQREQLYYLSIESGKSRRLTTEGIKLQLSSLGVTQNGAILTVPYNRSSQLWTMAAAGDAATARQLTNGLADGRAGISSLPDGRIAYIARAGDNWGVWTVAADGTNAKQITPDTMNVEEVRASPDGRYFYFATLESHPRFLRCDVDGANIVQVLNDESFGVDSAISPDGGTIVYSSSGNAGRQTLRTASASGIHLAGLTSTQAATPNFSPDGRYVSFIGEGDALTVVTFPEGQLTRTFKPAQVPQLNIGARWTPDGKALAYIVKQRTAGNIWLQPLDGSPPRPLTNFTSGDIYNFAFSTDGTRLLLARGYPIRDAVLIKSAA